MTKRNGRIREDGKKEEGKKGKSKGRTEGE
jgi:hypothetical protein